MSLINNKFLSLTNRLQLQAQAKILQQKQQEEAGKDHAGKPVIIGEHGKAAVIGDGQELHHKVVK